MKKEFYKEAFVFILNMEEMFLLMLTNYHHIFYFKSLKVQKHKKHGFSFAG